MKNYLLMSIFFLQVGAMAHAKHISLSTFNTNFSNKIKSSYSDFYQRMTGMSDLILLQRVSADQVSKLTEIFRDYDWKFAACNKAENPQSDLTKIYTVDNMTADKNIHGVLTLSKFPIKEAKNIVLPHAQITHTNQKYQGFCSLRSAIDVKGMRIAVYNTLPSYPEKEIKIGHWRDQLQFIFEQVKKDTESNVILAGDFHMHPGEQELWKGITVDGVIDVFAELKSTNVTTFNKSDGRVIRLDRIFIKKGANLRPLSGSVNKHDHLVETHNALTSQIKILYK